MKKTIIIDVSLVFFFFISVKKASADWFFNVIFN